MQRLLLLRHGESTWNVEQRWQGWLDAPLTPAGEAQAAARARTLAHESFAPRVIYTSDLQRAARTAEIIAAHVEAPVIADAGFRGYVAHEFVPTGDPLVSLRKAADLCDV